MVTGSGKTKQENGRRTDAQRFGPGGAVGIFINDIKINSILIQIAAND